VEIFVQILINFFILRYKNTVDDASVALKLNPSYVKAIFRRGKAYYALGELENAKVYPFPQF